MIILMLMRVIVAEQSYNNIGRNYTNSTRSNQFIINQECISASHSYGGTVANDKYGLKCLPWLESDVDENSNYCRNVDGDNMPWCYVKTFKKLKSYCDIPFCQDCYIPFDYTTRRECISTQKYNGTMSITSHGSKCLPWSCSSGINEESNYCRNIDGDKHGPWCYVLNYLGERYLRT